VPGRVSVPAILVLVLVKDDLSSYQLSVLTVQDCAFNLHAWWHHVASSWWPQTQPQDGLRLRDNSKARLRCPPLDVMRTGCEDELLA